MHRGKSAFSKRGSVNVRFAPKATDVLRCRELTRCANSGLMHRTKIASLDHFVGTQHKALRYYALERRPASKDCGRWGGSLGIEGNVTSAVD
jgi:hypothetical protein